MNKLVIPTILTATVLVAGMFAVMPVEKASSVHTTIIAAINNAQSGILGKRLVAENAVSNN